MISGGWVAAVGGLLILLALADGVRTRQMQGSPVSDAGATLRALAPGLWVSGLLAAFALALTSLGYFGCAALFMTVYLRSFGRYAWWRCVLGALIFAGVSSWVFTTLQVQLPKGFAGW